MNWRKPAPRYADLSPARRRMVDRALGKQKPDARIRIEVARDGSTRIQMEGFA